MAAPLTLTSFDAAGGDLPVATQSPPRELTRRLAENFSGWPMAWQVWQDVPFTPFGYPNGYPFARGASGTVNDRRGGKDLPLVWSEIDLRGFRVLSRFLCDTNQFAIGFLLALKGYAVRKGYGWQACLKGAKKTPYATAGAEADPVVERGQRVLDLWRDAAKWPIQSREAFGRWRRDGEVFGRLFFGGWKQFPSFRFIEPEQVGSPNGETSGPWSFGIETPEGDQAGPPTAFHLWELDGDVGMGDWHSADRILYLKNNVDSTIKRGLPDFFPVQEALDGTRRLLRNMVETAIVQAGVPWMEKFPTATVDQIRSLIPQRSVDNQPAPGSYPAAAWRNMTIDAGKIPRMEGNREIIPGPVSAGIVGYIAAEQAVLRGVGARWCMPEYLSGDASNNNFASALVAGSPFSVAVEGFQLEYGVWERSIALKVLELCRDAGLLSWDEWRVLDVEVTEPAVVTPDPLKDTQKRQILNAAKVLSVQTWQMQEQLDPQHEAENWTEFEARYPEPVLDPDAEKPNHPGPRRQPEAA